MILTQRSKKKPAESAGAEIALAGGSAQGLAKNANPVQNKRWRFRVPGFARERRKSQGWRMRHDRA
ncbi:MAG: hypothetical protein Q4C60_11510 [Eubacteriales bacterium]|nr:hypothetical protein [Eubacteriales bacterium]